MSPVTPAELDRLLALAEAATPGPWHVSLGSVYAEGRQPGWKPTPVSETTAIDARWPILAGENMRADAAFIAAANPDTIRALVADLRNLRAAFLEVATEAGEDTSDLDHADQLAFPTIQEFALAAVRGLREAYHEALDEPAVSA